MAFTYNPAQPKAEGFETLGKERKQKMDIGDVQKKRVRQVRDALNKCRDPELVEEIAALLGIRKYKSFQDPKEVAPAVYCGCGRRFQHAIIRSGVLVFSNSKPQQQARGCMACINCGKFWTSLT